MKSPPVMTVDLARSIGQDAANRAMRKAGRKRWSLEDYRAAIDAMNNALRLIDGGAQ